VQLEPGLRRSAARSRFWGPSDEYYDQLVAEQLPSAVAKTVSLGLREAFRSLTDRVLSQLPIEVSFDDGTGCGARNNSSVITLLRARRPMIGTRPLALGEA